MIILNESLYVGSYQGTKVMINSDAEINQWAVECKSDRRNGITSRFVLPHHRAYRSVHGGSLIYAIRFPIMIRKEDVPCLF